MVLAFLPVCARGAVRDEARKPGAELPEPERGDYRTRNIDSNLVEIL